MWQHSCRPLFLNTERLSLDDVGKYQSFDGQQVLKYPKVVVFAVTTTSLSQSGTCLFIERIKL